MDKRNVGILIFENVEVLDFAGPYEVFSRTRLEPGPESRRTEDTAPFRVFLIAREKEVVTATGGMRVLPDFDFESAPRTDILLIPGGFGTRPLLEDEALRSWIQRRASESQLVTSVCTGALLLARAGLLRERKATTHWGALDRLAEIDETIAVQRDERIVDDEIITSAGVAAGIDMSLAVVEKLFGQAVADETAHYIEYPRDRVNA